MVDLYLDMHKRFNLSKVPRPIEGICGQLKINAGQLAGVEAAVKAKCLDLELLEQSEILSSCKSLTIPTSADGCTECLVKMASSVRTGASPYAHSQPRLSTSS